MNDAEVEILKKAVKKGIVLYTPGSDTAKKVLKIAPHAEEGGSDPCAIFLWGHYAALYNCELSDFVLVTAIGEKKGRLW